MKKDNHIDHKLFVKENREVSFSEEVLNCFAKLVKSYPEGKQKSALLPILHIAQEESGGYLSVDVMDYVAAYLGIQPIEVYEVATFYSMFHLDKTGKYILEVCQTGPCAINGGEEVMEYLEEKLHLKADETSPDGLFTLKAVECLGGCGSAPVMQINNEFHEHMTTEKIDRIIEKLRSQQTDKPEGSRWVEKCC